MCLPKLKKFTKRRDIILIATLRLLIHEKNNKRNTNLIDICKSDKDFVLIYINFMFDFLIR